MIRIGRRVGGGVMANAAGGREATLITFEPMVDSQCARMLLDYYGLDWRERDHMIGWGSIVALVRTGKAALPVVCGKGFSIASPRPLAEHFDAALPAERRLIPIEAPLRAQVEQDWALFNGGMGAWTAHFAYYHLLPQRKVMSRVFAEPVPPVQAWLTKPLYPLLSGILKLGLKLGPERAQAAHDRIREAFDATDKRVSDGRPYLCGERITLGDFGLASAASALLLPSGYTAAMPTLDEMPPVLRGAIEELRGRPTAAFVQRFYSEGLAAARLR